MEVCVIVSKKILKNKNKERFIQTEVCGGVLM